MSAVNLGRIDFNLLKVLDALIIEQNVTRAGKRLGRSQPAVSNAVQRLRHLLGDDLLVRGPKGFVLTAGAEAMRGSVHEAIARIEGCLTPKPQFDPTTATGVFRLSMPDRLSIAVVPPLFTRLRELAPNMALQVLTADRKQALDLLDDDQIDLALGWLDEKPSHLNNEFMMDESFFCVLRRDHPILKPRAKFDISSVFSFPHLIVSATGRRSGIFDELLPRKGPKRYPLAAVTNFSAVPHMLVRSDMISVFTELAADVFEEAFGLAKKPVPIKVNKMATNMVWRGRDDKDQKHFWLREQVRAVYRMLRQRNGVAGQAFTRGDQ